jgi:hypothetical protein
MIPHRLFSCFHPSSHPLVLGVAHVVVPAVTLVVVLIVVPAETQCPPFPYSFPCLFLSAYQPHVAGASG